MSHTQGKLIAGEEVRSSGWVDILDENNSRLPVAYATPATYSEAGCPIERRDEETIANARRLVACWNACEGISTDALESGVTLIEAFQREEIRADIAERQRDELLAAFERLIGAYSNSHSPSVRQDCWDHARRAIANVKGEA